MHHVPRLQLPIHRSRLSVQGPTSERHSDHRQLTGQWLELRRAKLGHAPFASQEEEEFLLKTVRSHLHGKYGQLVWLGANKKASSHRINLRTAITQYLT